MRWLMNTARLSLLVLVIAILSGCAAVGENYTSQAIPKIAKGKSQLIVYRPYMLIGSGESPTIYINGTAKCELSSGGFLVSDINAGEVKVVSALYGGTVKSNLTFKSTQGKKYYVKLTPNTAIAIGGAFGAVGALAASSGSDDNSVYPLHLMDNNIAEQEIIGTKLSQDCKSHS